MVAQGTVASTLGIMLHRMTLVEMAAQIQAKQISPVELFDAHARRIEALNPRLKAFLTLRLDRAREEAQAAEQAVMNDAPLGPLHGVPVSIKDSFDVAGLPTWCGSQFYGQTAAQDSAAAERLKRAGAILLGKTNTPEFLANYESDNHLLGWTANPWNQERTAGGSSGGEAAALAAGLAAGGVGSDGGGSIRVPAHFCGIAGLKPTPGRVSAFGHVPPMQHPGGMLGVAGPMARTVRDVEELFDVLSPHDWRDPFSAPVLAPGPLTLDDIRIGVMEQFYQVPVQECVRQAIRTAAKAAKDAGLAVDEFTPQGWDKAPNVWSFFFTELPSRLTAKFIEGRQDRAHWTGTEFLERILQRPAPSWEQMYEMLGERDRLRRVLLEQMQTVDVLLLPVAGVPAFRTRERSWPTATKEIGLFQAMMPSTAFNLLGFPGLSVPFGFSEDGLPVGVQLVGRPYEEDLLLDVGLRLEEVRGAFPGPELS
jgi:Asp-tRNA(Asn)/Glu-tRNA(Gln) amidotransferase A subunit family amidase